MFVVIGIVGHADLCHTRKARRGTPHILHKPFPDVPTLEKTGLESTTCVTLFNSRLKITSRNTIFSVAEKNKADHGISENRYGVSRSRVGTTLTYIEWILTL